MLKDFRYSSLHTHTEYSNLRMLDSINRIPEMFDWGLENGLNAIAITDHESLSSHVKAIKHYKNLSEEEKEQIKLILGNEIYLVDEAQQERQNHFLLLAKDKKGFELLKELSSRAWSNAYMKGPMMRVPLKKSDLVEIIGDNKGHLVASTACLGGELPYYVNNLVGLETTDKDNIKKINHYKRKIVDFIKFGQEVFGEENFFIEIQPSNHRDQIMYNMRVKEIAEGMKVPMIATTDAHYLLEEDRVVHDAFLRARNESRDTAQYYRSAHFMTAEEMYKYDSIKNFYTEEEFIKILENTNKIADMCEFYDVHETQEVPYVDRSEELAVLEKKHTDIREKVDFDKYPSLKRIVESDNKTNRYWLFRIVDFLERKDLLNHEYINRIDIEAEEMHAISDRMGENIFGYYVTMTKIQEIVWGKANAIIGVSRGSVAGYLSAYALEIQGVDSIKYDLPHWRHLSRERPELPDIDFDTPASRRTNVILATKDYFGEDKVLNIATFKTEGPRSAIQTACRGYRSEEYPYGIKDDDARHLSSLIANDRGRTRSISETYYGDEEKGFKPSAVFKKEMDKYEGLLDIVLKIEGIVSGRSSHASGVYIYNNKYTEHNAMMKAPNGLSTTQFDMDDSDYQGGLKFDFLTVKAIDMLQVALEMLIEDGYVEDQGSLKANYDLVIGPETLPDTPEVWRYAYDREIIKLFQFDTPVGGEAIEKVKPKSLLEAAHVNSLMRLQPTERGGESPTDKYIRFRDNPHLWEEEMTRAGLTEEEKEVMREHLGGVAGVAATQEELMRVVMDKRIGNFSLVQANSLRKAVAKANADAMKVVLDDFYETGTKAGTSKDLLKYVEEYVIHPQAGYAFSELHTIAYSMIALQELALFHNYPQVFWNTAVLIVESGSVGEVINEEFEYLNEQKERANTVQYGQIAKAIGEITSAGIRVAPPHINTARIRFVPDAENNRILYSLQALAGVAAKDMEQILELRPFKSLEDCLERTNLRKPSAVSLIKSGAFDELEERPREEIMKDYITSIADTKKRLNLQNYKALDDRNLLGPELKENRALWHFTRYIRQKQFRKDDLYLLDNRAQGYLDKNYPHVLASANLDESGMLYISKPSWDSIYTKEMDTSREWIKKNQEELLDKLNQKMIQEEWDKYASGDISKWEMDSMSYYSHDHELTGANLAEHGISHFENLPEYPIVDYTFKIDGKEIPLYKIDKIVGTCIDKNNMRSTFTLLTEGGSVVNIRMNNEQFAYYNKQISVDNGDGTKRVAESSWFSRGNKLMVVGYRRGSAFVPKRYARTPEKHSVYLITDMDEKGSLQFQSERFGQ